MKKEVKEEDYAKLGLSLKDGRLHPISVSEGRLSVADRENIEKSYGKKKEISPPSSQGTDNKIKSPPPCSTLYTLSYILAILLAVVHVVLFISCRSSTATRWFSSCREKTTKWYCCSSRYMIVLCTVLGLGEGELLKFLTTPTLLAIHSVHSAL